MLFSVLVSADLRLSQPMVRVVVCCARTACGADKHAAAAPIAAMKSRRLISPPKGRWTWHHNGSAYHSGRGRCPLWVKSGGDDRGDAAADVCFAPESGQIADRLGMSAFGGEFNESTQHLLILADEEVCEWRGMHGHGSRRNRRLSCGSAGRAVNVWRTSRERLRGGTRAASIGSWLAMEGLLQRHAGGLW